MAILDVSKNDEKGYNEYYKGDLFYGGFNKDEFKSIFESQLKPFSQGGITKGYVRGMSTRMLLKAASASGVNKNEITVLDAGCGLGGLSVYLALQGFNVIGIDIAKEACQASYNLAEGLGVIDRVKFHAASLEEIPLSNSSIDFIIGHASLHHFIKYEQVPTEFHRVLKKDGEGFFADSFGENKIYSIFHDKEKMQRLGDVSLTKEMITTYFSNLNPIIIPTDWFVMIDKLYIKILPSSATPILRKISKLHFWLDRKIPNQSRLALSLSGSILTRIKK